MDDFSNMDTSVYWDRAKKYLPPQIDMLFIAESPPAFKDSNKKAYFYFEFDRCGPVSDKQGYKMAESACEG
jgi:hypothetical protein